MSEKYMDPADLPDGWHLGLVRDRYGDLSPRWVRREGHVDWESSQEGGPGYLASWDAYRLVTLLHRADECRAPVWRECDPDEVQIGWLVERRLGDRAVRDRVKGRGEFGSLTVANGGVIWSSVHRSHDWTLWTTEPAPVRFTAEEEALRELLGDRLGAKPDDETLREVIAKAKAISGDAS